MSPEQIEFVLASAYHSGWITVEQYHAAHAGLQDMPNVSAIDFLVEQQMIDAAQAEGLRQALQPPAPAVEATPEPAEIPAEEAPAPPPLPTPRIAAQQPTLAAHQPVPVAVAHAPEVEIVREGGPVDGMNLNDLLRLGFNAGASDVHIGVSAPPLMRLHGTLQPLYHNAPILRAQDTEALLPTFLNKLQLEYLEKHKGIDFSYEVPGMARLRSSVIQQRKGFDAVFRIINTKVRTMDELGMPKGLKTLTEYHNGLVLVTGAVGSGKSTTLAAMVQEVNTHRHDHIITLEDPIEYVFVPAGCQITQREVHSHTKSFGAALRASLREDPDVIIVGEMRDLETIQLAITASETGHLVIATLHTSNAARTLDRILDAFPVEQQSQIRTMVSESLRGIISQQLVPKADGSGRIAAHEIMVNTPAVAALIRDSKTYMLPGVIQTGKRLGMKLMDDSLLELMEAGTITPNEAYDRAEQKKVFQPYLK
jgi:twitching motility protein PilT